MKQESSESFGDLLRDFRLAAGLSQEALAERAKMSLGGVSVLERGARRSPHRDTIAHLASGLCLSSEDRERLEAAAERSPQPRRRTTTGRQAPLSHNLPTELTSFVGRDSEISQIASLLNDQRFVTLVGIGGVGKTRTALHVARKILDSAQLEVCLVDLSSIDDASTASAIARAMGVEETPNQEPLEALLAYLARKTILLILDNCERVISGAANVAREIACRCSNARILATSRVPLKVHGEHVYRLRPLRASDAMALFADRAFAIDHRFILSDENKSLVAGICQRLDGIPLAIELAAARIGVLPLKVLFEKLDQRFAILTAGHHDASPRQRTMRALIDWSYDLLSSADQRVFEQLSVFAGGCTLEAAAGICLGDELHEAVMLDTLASLVDKSLVVADLDGDEPRYLLLESMREYAREKLSERGELDLVRHRHALFFYKLAANMESASDSGPWLSDLKGELENWRAALDWTLNSRGDVELGLRLVGALRPVWSSIAAGEGRRWTHLSFELADEHTPLSIIAQLEFVDACIASRLGEKQHALEAGRRALIHFQETDDAFGTAQAQCFVGFVLTLLGRAVEAEPLLQEATETARGCGWRWLTAQALESVGVAYSLKGQVHEATSCYAEAMATFKEVGDRRRTAITAGNFAEVAFRAGDAATALRLAEESLEAFDESDHSRAATLVNLSAYQVALARYDEARRSALDTIKIARDCQQYVVLWSLQHLATIAVLRPRDNDCPGTAIREAARLLGFVDKQAASLGAARESTEQQEYDRALEALTKTLGSAKLKNLMVAGVSMTEDQAVELAEGLE